MSATLNITCRHADITEAIRTYATQKISAVVDVYPQIEHTHVILDVQKFRHIVEIVIQAKNHLHVEAKDESDDMYKSIDGAADKVDRQLRKSREKKVDHKIPGHRAKLSDFEKELAEPTDKT